MYRGEEGKTPVTTACPDVADRKHFLATRELTWTRKGFDMAQKYQNIHVGRKESTPYWSAQCILRSIILQYNQGGAHKKEKTEPHS